FGVVVLMYMSSASVESEEERVAARGGLVAAPVPDFQHSAHPQSAGPPVDHDFSRCFSVAPCLRAARRLSVGALLNRLQFPLPVPPAGCPKANPPVARDCRFPAFVSVVILVSANICAPT